MINIYIKQMSGNLLSIQYDIEWSTERLHDCVYDILPFDIKPSEKWKIMLFLRGDWIIANKNPLDLSDGDILDMLIETGTYDVDFPLEDYKNGIWRNELQIRGSVHIDFPFYVNEEKGLWYFEEEIEETQYNIRNPQTIPHIDAHEFINTLDVSLCVKEFIYSHYFSCYAEILSQNVPRPNSYYCNYDWEEKDGEIFIKRSACLS